MVVLYDREIKMTERASIALNVGATKQITQLALFGKTNQLFWLSITDLCNLLPKSQSFIIIPSCKLVMPNLGTDDLFLISVVYVRNSSKGQSQTILIPNTVPFHHYGNNMIWAWSNATYLTGLGANISILSFCLCKILLNQSSYRL